MLEELLREKAEQLNEELDMQKNFLPTTITYSRKMIMNTINEDREDDEKDPIPAEKFTDEICQKYADDMGDALWDTAGESMASADIDIVIQLSKKLEK